MSHIERLKLYHNLSDKFYNNVLHKSLIILLFSNKINYFIIIEL